MRTGGFIIVICMVILSGCGNILNNQGTNTPLPLQASSTMKYDEKVDSVGVQSTSPIKTTAENVMETPMESADIASSSITVESTPSPRPDVTNANKDLTVVIDAGHQKNQNSGKEPIGPGSSIKKKKVSSGTQGVVTKVPEYQVNLQVSLKLRDILKKQGYRVIMIREKNDVNISNAQRAKIANKYKADAFVRIHCNGSENAKENGAFTICPTKDNRYCSQIYQKSRKLSEYVLKELCISSGAKKRNIMETDSMSGINWSKVPVTIVEMGYMTNRAEDRKLSDADYQKKLSVGIANGIQKFLNN